MGDTKRGTPFERLGDRFSTTDERLEYLIQVLTNSGVFDLGTKINTISSLLGGQVMLTGETYQIRFMETLAPLTGDKFAELCPWPAVNTSVAFHFPPGCNALVDVVVGHSDRQTYPRTGYIALNDASPVFQTYELISEHEPIWAEIRNADGINSHTITIIMTIQRRKSI